MEYLHYKSMKLLKLIYRNPLVYNSASLQKKFKGSTIEKTHFLVTQGYLITKVVQNPNGSGSTVFLKSTPKGENYLYTIKRENRKNWIIPIFTAIIVSLLLWIITNFLLNPVMDKSKPTPTGQNTTATP